MNAQDARDVVERLGAGAFFSVGFADQTWCLVQDGEQWCVFFAERGSRSAERRYPSEDAAARAFLSKLVSNPDVRPA